MIRMECEYCDKQPETEAQMRTHMLIHHPEEIDGDEYDIPVSKGFLEEKDIPKGEQFGYRK